MTDFFSANLKSAIRNLQSEICNPLPDHCRPFPGPASGDLRRGAKRNFQVFTALDFLAEVTQHIPEKGEHLVRYYGWYSHRRRGMRSVWHQLCAAPGGPSRQSEPDTLNPKSEILNLKSPSIWAMLIQRIYEVDPLKCPKCGGKMKIISFIERGQADVIERILKHCGLWEGPIRTLANPRPPPGTGPPVPDPDEYELVPDGDYLDAQAMETCLPSSSLRSQASSLSAGDYQLVLDPEFL